MSEELDLETDNLCTTEDAFESFQANTLYEEEEYITLSDLISPENTEDVHLPESCLDKSKTVFNAPNLNTADLNNKIEVETVNNCDEDLKNEQPCISFNSKQNVSNASKSNLSQKPKPSGSGRLGRPKAKKRGRPRKTSTPQAEVPISSNNYGIPQSNQSNGELPQKSPKKRGRKSKKELSEKTKIGNENIEVDPKLTDGMDSSQVVSSTMNDSLLVEVPVKRSRRGRKRKIDIPQETIETINRTSASKPRRKAKINSRDIKLTNTSESAHSESLVNSTDQPQVSEPAFDVATDCKTIVSDTTLQNDAIDSSLMLSENNEQENSMDEGDDICLSKLKFKLNEASEAELKEVNKNIDEIDKVSSKQKETPSKREPKKIQLNDFECNIDTIVINREVTCEPIMRENNEQEIDELGLLKRSARRRTKQTFKYDEESDEDPYANVELSDDEPQGRKKGKYHSDDEYKPGKMYDSPESSLESDGGTLKLEERPQRKKKSRSPRKGKNKKMENNNSSITDVECPPVDMDIENALQGTVLFKDKGTSENITEFLAKKIPGTDIKITKAKSSPAPKLEIPILDLNEAKKCTETSTQTITFVRATSSTQTDSQHDYAMQKQVKLSTEQAEKACEFLKSIVETTAELGELMTQKSQDFIAKKINTNNVTDTLKMDYCVKKSFLLFKLAKHNLMQMEQDLETKYEEFLDANNLLQYRESKKVITPQHNTSKSDSDCEIVEEVKPAKPKFNPKTVFLNKELSIKIAKTSKPEPSKPVKKYNAKGRHTVWLNDSVMVKKVQPNQSFLAQDSRNKKPPDYVTYEMVKSFFDGYYRKQNVALYCRPFTSTEWLSVKNDCVCRYFIKDANDFETALNDNIINIAETHIDTPSITINKFNTNENLKSPKPLLTICIEFIQKHFCAHNGNANLNENVQNEVENGNSHPKDCRISDVSHTNTLLSINKRLINGKVKEVASLKYICTLKINSLLSYSIICNPKDRIFYTPIRVKETLLDLIEDIDVGAHNVKSLSNLCFKVVEKCFKPNIPIDEDLTVSTNIKVYKVGSLSKLCFKVLKKYFLPTTTLHTANSLQMIATQAINQMLSKNVSSIYIENNDINLSTHLENSNIDEGLNCSMPMIINCVSTVTEEDFSNLHPDSEAMYTDENDDYIEDDTYDRYDDDESNGLDENYTEHYNIETKVQLQKLRCDLPIVASPNVSNLEIINEDVTSDPISIAQIKIEPEESEQPEQIMVKTEPLDIDEVLPETVSVIRPKQEPMDGMVSRRGSFTCAEDLFETFASSVLVTTGEKSNRIRQQHTPDIDTCDEADDLLVPRSVERAKDMLMENSSDDENNYKKLGRKKGKLAKNKNITKEVPVAKNKNKETAKRIKEKSVNEQTNESSDSEMDISLTQRRVRKQILEKNKNKTENKLQENISKPSDEEIQCNDVDSTEFITPDINPVLNERNTRNKRSRKREISPSQETQHSIEEQTSIFDQDVPAELLECEPDINVQNEPIKNKFTEKQSSKIDKKLIKAKHDNYVEKYGWKCYSVDHSDSKLYDNVSIVLEKLPTNKSGNESDDDEVNRLTNLNSLHRSRKDRAKPKDKNVSSKHTKSTTESTSKNDANIDDDHYSEFTPSEDDGEDTGNMHVNTNRPRNADNCAAKNLLMDDNDSDSDQADRSAEKIKIKKEPGAEDSQKVKARPGPKSKTKVNVKTNDDVMLTADIMMNPELTRLNTPAYIKEEILPDVKEDASDTKDGKKKSSARLSSKKPKVKIEVKQEDDSSSEEEKQWVSTKEKMLKRMERKNETIVDDEAKGAKRVSEFIEKRGDAPESKQRTQRGRKRSLKKMLEKRKQLKILARGIHGDQLSARKCAQYYGKGRRNIRKVLNKQNLKDETKRANIEEADRKSRIAVEQAKLKMHLGCEDGVNVIVINDELCLEYDFQNNCSLVSVNPFFTKVMKAHQYEGVKFMWDACFEKVSRVSGGHPGGGCILAHCMGLGKTLQVLALLHTVLTHPMLNMKRVLVVCPLSTVLNWVDEIHKWIGPVTDQIKVFELSKLKKTYERAFQLEDWYKQGGIFIIGYELFRSLTTIDPEFDSVRQTTVDKIRTALLDPGPDIIVCDEGHLLKNDCSVLAVAMSMVTTQRRIVLTGTPMQNNLREYYCMVNFIRPSLLGTYSEFSNRFENPIMNGQHRDSRDDDIRLMKQRTHILHKVLEGCLQRQEASVLYPYLKKKYEYTVFIPLTQCQQDIYKHYLYNYTSKGKQSVLKDFHILQKIWTHPKVLHNFQTKPREEKLKVEKIEDDLAQEDMAASEAVNLTGTEQWWLRYLSGDMLNELDSSNKLHVVFRLLHECVALGDKVLIFSTSLVTMDTLEYFLREINQWRLGHEYYRLDGSVPADVRQKWCREFNAENNHVTKLFLVSTRAGCLGLNMTAANRVIILDTSWNPAHDIQSIFRVYRFGQKKDCYIYRLVAMGTMEQKIYERSVTKQAVACRVVDEQQIDRHYNSAELTELYSWDEDGWGVAAGMTAGVRDPALLRAAAAGRVHAVREHDSLLRGSEPALPESERAAAWRQFQLEHEHAQTQPPPIVLIQPTIEIEVPPVTFENIPTTSKVKEKKNSQAKKREEASTSQSNDDSDKQEVLVKKIMSILIKNQVDDSIPPEKLAKLIRNVKRLLASKMQDTRGISDPIAIDIAKILLHDEETLRDQQTTHFTDPNQAKKYRKSREATPDSTDLNAPEHVDPSDVEWVGDTKYEYNKITKKDSKSKKKQREKRIKRTNNETVIEEPAHENSINTGYAQNDRQVTNDSIGFANSNAGHSILISDDEDVEPVDVPRAIEPVKEKAQKTQEKNKQKKDKKAGQNKEAEKPRELVPLHPSLLVNENFIKLVSNVYLRGNPKLAEDAALMAAQYSAHKARSEYEATGVPITCGNLYEIAVERLGIDQLKQIHEMISTEPLVLPQPAASTSSNNNETQEDESEMVVPDAVTRPRAGPKSKTKGLAGPKSRKKIDYIEEPQIEVTVISDKPPEPVPQNIYPVGMFIGANKGASAPVIEECSILPDDDENDIIITQPKPPLPPQPAKPLEMVVIPPKVLRKIITSEQNSEKPQNIQRVTYDKKRTKKETIGVNDGVKSKEMQHTVVAFEPERQRKEPTVANESPQPSLLQRLATAIKRIRTKAHSTDTSDATQPMEVQQDTPIVQQLKPLISTDNSEPICLSDSDDDGPPTPAASSATIAPPLALAASPPRADPPALPPSKLPNGLRPVSFTGGTPFVLTPLLKKILDPNKEYYCIKSSTLIDSNAPNNINPNELVPLEVHRKNNEASVLKRKQSTAAGPASQSQDYKKKQHVNINATSGSLKSTPSASQPSMLTREFKTYKSKIDSTSSSKPSDPKPSTSQPAVTSSVGAVKSLLKANRKEQPAPASQASGVPSSLFDDVIIIPAESYGTNKPSPKSKKTIVTQSSQPGQQKAQDRRFTVNNSSDKGNSSKPLSNSSLPSRLPLNSSKPLASSSKSILNYSIDQSKASMLKKSEERKTKLLLLKKEEKAKFKTLQRIESASTSQSSLKNRAFSDVIDLTSFPEKPKVKRPSPWIDKKAIKKPKVYQTLEDFDLEDIRELD